MQDSPTDPEIPIHIEHSIDEIWNGNELEHSYNFLDYHFEYSNAYFRARVYLDEIETVTLFGPFNRRGSISKIAAPKEEEITLSYLRRRFATVRHR